MITECSSAKKLIFLVTASLLLGLFPSCASKPKAEKTEVLETEEESLSSLPMYSENRYKPYFYGIPEDSLLDVENGSPASLRRAVAAIRKSDMDYQENERVLVFIASNIMQIVWPSERVDWEIPALTSETSYSGAIGSVKYGLFDTSTGKVDYLATLLPCLVVVKVDDVKPFFAEAERDLLGCLSTHKDSLLVNYLLGTLYKKNGNLSAAQNYYSVCAKSAPENFQCVYAYAGVLNGLSKFKESFNLTQGLLEKYPRNLNVLALNADNAFKLKNFQVAEENIAKILQQNPNDLNALLYRIRILIEKKDFIHAASLLDVYSRQDSTSRDYLLLRAKVQYDWSKNVNGAISTMETALSLYPDDKELQLFAARLANSSKTKISGKSSEDIANAVLVNDPSNDIALQYAVEGLVQKGEWQKAYEQSKILVSGQNVEQESVFLHINICLAIGKNDEAWNLINPIYRNNSTDENVIQTYIKVLHATNRNNQALNMINQLLPESTSKMKSFLYYMRSLLKNREEEVLSDLRSSLIANPRNSDALFKLYEIYNSKKDYRKAQYYLKQVVALNPNDMEMRELNDELTIKIQNSVR